MRHIVFFVLASLLLSNNVQAERALKTDIKGVRLGATSVDAQKAAGNCVSSASSFQVHVCNGSHGDSFTLGETHYRKPPVVANINYSFVRNSTKMMSRQQSRETLDWIALKSTKDKLMGTIISLY